MIGLEYVLKLWDTTQTELANKLELKQQNIDAWVKGKRNIPKKHLPKLKEIFNIPKVFFQKELLDKDKLTIQQLKIKNELITYDYEYKEFNEELKEEVTVTGLYYILNIKNISQQELATKLGVTKQLVNMWARGMKPISKRHQSIIEEVLQTNMDVLNKKINENIINNLVLDLITKM